MPDFIFFHLYLFKKLVQTGLFFCWRGTELMLIQPETSGAAPPCCGTSWACVCLCACAPSVILNYTAALAIVLWAALSLEMKCSLARRDAQAQTWTNANTVHTRACVPGSCWHWPCAAARQVAVLPAMPSRGLVVKSESRLWGK